MKKKSDAVVADLAVATRLPARTDLHITRKVWHIVMGTLIAGLYFFGMERGTAVMTLGFFLALFLSIEMARLRFPKLNQLSVKFMAPFMRASEVKELSGVPYYLTAAIFAIGIFPKSIAVLSLLYLAWGDPIASLAGILYGKKGYRFKNGKSLVGSAAGFVVCFITTFIFLNFLPVSVGTLFIISVIGGIAGAGAEILPLDVNDNLSIPIVSGFLLWFAFIVMGL